MKGSAYPIRRSAWVLATLAMAMLLSQSGCSERAPAEELERRAEAQKKRAESFKDEVRGPKQPVRSARSRNTNKH